MVEAAEQPGGQCFSTFSFGITAPSFPVSLIAPSVALQETASSLIWLWLRWAFAAVSGRTGATLLLLRSVDCRRGLQLLRRRGIFHTRGGTCGPCIGSGFLATGPPGSSPVVKLRRLQPCCAWVRPCHGRCCPCACVCFASLRPEPAFAPRGRCCPAGRARAQTVSPAGDPALLRVLRTLYSKAACL